jgi:hypothetical protein
VPLDLEEEEEPQALAPDTAIPPPI